MAELQGLLQGTDLSPVQIIGIRLLSDLEEQDKVRQRVGQFGFERFVSLYPEYRPSGGEKESEAERVDLTDEDELDAVVESTAGGIRYEAPEESISEDEFNRLMVEAASGSFSGDDLEGGWV
jgi:hypothetical protein